MLNYNEEKSGWGKNTLTACDVIFCVQLSRMQVLVKDLYSCSGHEKYFKVLQAHWNTVHWKAVKTL